MARIRLLFAFASVLGAVTWASPAATVYVSGSESMYVGAYVAPDGLSGDYARVYAISSRSAGLDAGSPKTTDSVRGCIEIYNRSRADEFGCGTMTMTYDATLDASTLKGVVRSGSGQSMLHVDLVWRGYDRPEVVYSGTTCDRPMGPACERGWVRLVRQARAAGRIWSSTSPLRAVTDTWGILDRSISHDAYVPEF
jgi:hypothetical protein